MIRKSCYYYEWFGDYSLDCCNNPKRDSQFSTNECNGCQHFITRKNHRINELKERIAMLENQLKREMKGSTK